MPEASRKRREEMSNVGDRPKPEHDTFDEFMEMEWARLQEHASGKMARALGYALPGESQEELERIAREDQRLAQEEPRRTVVRSVGRPRHSTTGWSGAG